MDQLASMRAFVTVGRTQSFTKAAALLGVSAPQLSRAIADLEEHTHSLLFHRTTRRVSLADGARDYFETCTQILEQSVLCHGDAELGLQYPHKRLMSGRARSFVTECLDFFAPGNRIPEGPPSLLAA